MIPITFVAAVPGPIGAAIHFAHHTIEATRDGQLQHSIDGVVCATVPPEGWEQYARDWPQAADIVRQLRRPTPDAEKTLPGGPPL